MADLRMTGDAARRAADAAECLLRSAGGRAVYLRLPTTPATPGVNGELGLAVPEFEDAEMSPVVFRRARPQPRKDGTRWELMVSAESVDALLGSSGATDASELFGGAAGVLVDGTLMEIESAASSDAGGRPYVYRLVLRTPEVKRV